MKVMESGSDEEYVTARETHPNGVCVIQNDPNIVNIEIDQIDEDDDQSIPGGSEPTDFTHENDTPNEDKRISTIKQNFPSGPPEPDSSEVSPSVTEPSSEVSSLGAERRPSLEGANDVDASILGLHKRHVFVMSEAGKPIYTRHGNEDEMSPLFGLLQVMVSFFEAVDDNLESITSGRWKIVFIHRAPLILAASCRAQDTVGSLKAQLDGLYFEIVRTLTRTQMIKVFEHRTNYDLRRLLAGTEKCFDRIVSSAAKDPSLRLNAVRCLHMDRTMRDSLAQAIVYAAGALKVKNLVFAVVIARDQLVTMVRMKKYTLHPSDLHLMINLVACSQQFRHSESWSPICLPRFDDTGYLHAHISYLSDTSDTCLLLLTVDRNAFFTLSSLKARLIERLKSKAIDALSDSCKQASGVRMSEAGIQDLWHFLYKNRTSSQLCSALFEEPFVSAGERRQLLDCYLSVIDNVHRNDIDATDKTHVRIWFVQGEKQSILAWVTSNFELYAAFSPLVQRHAAMTKVEKLIKWLKKEEEKLFILSSHFF